MREIERRVHGKGAGSLEERAWRLSFLVFCGREEAIVSLYLLYGREDGLSCLLPYGRKKGWLSSMGGRRALYCGDILTIGM